MQIDNNIKIYNENYHKLFQNYINNNLENRNKSSINIIMIAKQNIIYNYKNANIINKSFIINMINQSHINKNNIHSSSI